MKGWLLSVLVVSTMGCSSMFPYGESKVVSQWETFDQAKQAFDQVMPYETREAELHELGYSPSKQPNVHILNHAEIAERFVLGSFDGSNLPAGLQHCLNRGADCYGYEMRQRFTKDQRYGSFLADFLNFKRKTETRGWEFNALIVLIDEQVVYKLWSGKPDIHEYRDQTNPLGPLQGVGGALTPRPEL